jgi:transketolase
VICYRVKVEEKLNKFLKRSGTMKIKERLGQWWDKSRESRRRMGGYWRNLMASTKQKISQGAASIKRLITSAHKDNWRRKDKR